jgi:hypothetical protein
MAYDVRFRGVHLFVTDTSSSAHQHYFVDTRMSMSGDAGGASASFWPVSFSVAGHNPYCAYDLRDVVPGNTTSSNVLFGGSNGVIYHYSRTKDTDVSETFSSYVDYGPFPLSTPGREGLLQEVQTTLGDGSCKVLLQVRTGQSAEETYNATPLAYQSLYRDGLNPKIHPRLRGNSGMLRLSGDGTSSNYKWSVEDVTVRRVDSGERRV